MNNVFAENRQIMERLSVDPKRKIVGQSLASEWKEARKVTMREMTTWQRSISKISRRVVAHSMDSNNTTVFSYDHMYWPSGTLSDGFADDYSGITMCIRQSTQLSPGIEWRINRIGDFGYIQTEEDGTEKYIGMDLEDFTTSYLGMLASIKN